MLQRVLAEKWPQRSGAERMNPITPTHACCHELLRKVDAVTPEGRTTPDGDRLAKDINNYLNHIGSHSHDCWR
jgi:hypothetical protein